MQEDLYTQVICKIWGHEMSDTIYVVEKMSINTTEQLMIMAASKAISIHARMRETNKSLMTQKNLPKSISNGCRGLQIAIVGGVRHPITTG